MTDKFEKPEKCECHYCTLIRAGIHPGVIGDHFHSRKAGKKPSERIKAMVEFMTAGAQGVSPAVYEQAILDYLDEQEAEK